MSERLYYTAPSEQYFEEVKVAAIKVWNQYDDTFGYASEKTKRISNIQNVSDNFMYIVAMFDYPNQRKLANLLSDETRKEIRDRMIDGGNPLEYIPF